MTSWQLLHVQDHWSDEAIHFSTNTDSIVNKMTIFFLLISSLFRGMRKNGRVKQE